MKVLERYTNVVPHAYDQDMVLLNLRAFHENLFTQRHYTFQPNSEPSRAIIQVDHEDSVSKLVSGQRIIKQIANDKKENKEHLYLFYIPED